MTAHYPSAEKTDRNRQGILNGVDDVLEEVLGDKRRYPVTENDEHAQYHSEDHLGLIVLPYITNRHLHTRW